MTQCGCSVSVPSVFTRPVFEVRQAREDGGDNVDMAYIHLCGNTSPQTSCACHPRIYLLDSIYNGLL